MSEVFCPDLIAIDGNSLLHRAFYALPDMRSKDGVPTGAVYGFLSMLFPLIDKEPAYLLVAFDKHGPTFRHETYSDYKAGRKETPEDLKRQFPVLKEILSQMGIFTYELERYEADDILGTVSKRFEDTGKNTLLVSGDRDGFQLVSENVHLLLTKKGISESIEYTPELLMETYGLIPERMKDLKALMGDVSDHIPGIAGIGEKTALQLLHEYGSLDGILQNADNLKGKLKDKVINGTEDAKMSYMLGTIDRNIPAKIQDEDMLFKKDSIIRIIPYLEKLGMNSTVTRIRQMNGVVKETKSTEIHTISTENELKQLVSEIERNKRISFLTKPELSVSTNNSINYVFSKGETLFDEGLTFHDALNGLKTVFENKDIEKITFDFKSCLHIFEVLGIHPDGNIHDCLLAEYLLNSTDKMINLDDLTDKYQMQGVLSSSNLFEVSKSQKESLSDNNLKSLYEDIELPFLYVLFGMEQAGFEIDTEILKELGTKYRNELDRLQSEIYTIARCEFNILSPKQLGELLFEKMGLPYSKKTKSGFSTDADTLNKLRGHSDIVDPILQYRFINKLNSTYVDGLSKSIDASDRRIHTKFNQCATATGRISSSEPNLQNIPVRTEEGKEIRKAFIAKEGFVLIDGDYSQIELRILAHLSKDDKMIQAFHSGEDIHSKTASEVFKTPLSEVTSDMRSAAKAVNFGIVYGISDFGLSNNLNISVEEARNYIKSYLSTYTGIDSYMKECVERAKTDGYAITMFGRRRPLPELHSSNYNVRSFGERVAMNMPVQGTAADIIKIAMCKVNRAIQDMNLKTRLIMQVHDELILEVPEEETETANRLLKECMENVCELTVPLVTEIHTGKSWNDAK